MFVQLDYHMYNADTYIGEGQNVPLKLDNFISMEHFDFIAFSVSVGY